MRKFSGIGATALALALSVTFLTPTTALAANKEKDYGAETSVYVSAQKTNDTYQSSLISKDVKVVGEYATSEERDAAFAPYATMDGYNATSKTRAGKTVYVITYTTWKNEVTGAVSAKQSDVDPAAKTVQGLNTVYIHKGEVTLLNVGLQSGDIAIKNVKSSKKKIVTATADKYNVYKYVTNDNIDDYETDENGNYCYYTSTGKKVILPKNEYGYLDTSSAEYKASNASNGTAGIKLVAKKAGTAYISYDIYNKDGVKTGTAKVKVVVRAENSIFKTFTFGGKSLIQKTYGDTKYINYGKEAGAHDNDFVDKAKGKLVVKANKGYKIVKIEIGTLSEKTLNGYYQDGFGDYYNEDNEYHSTSETDKTTYHPVDLNGDGDYLDRIRGYDEKNGSRYYTYKKVNSGKTIKLSTVGIRSSGNRTFNYKKTKNAAGELISSKGEWVDQSAKAPTLIRVTYYDQAAREYKVTEKTLYTSAKIKGSKKK